MIISETQSKTKLQEKFCWVIKYASYSESDLHCLQECFAKKSTCGMEKSGCDIGEPEVLDGLHGEIGTSLSY